MFKSLREKLSSVINKFSKTTEEEGVVEEVEVKEELDLQLGGSDQKEVTKKEKEKVTKEVKKEVKKTVKKEVKTEVPVTKEVKEEPVKEDVKEEVEEKPVEVKTGFFSRKIIKISEDKFEEIFFEMEMALLSNNVAVEAINGIKDKLFDKLTKEGIPKGKTEEVLKNILKEALEELLNFEQVDLLKLDAKPLKILFVGINGSGKTTTIAKICKLFQDNDKKVVLVASDTFRAAAIQQLEHHANTLKVKMIKQDYGADPAAVAFDAVKYAQAHNTDVVLIDTAGRLHTNQNLMDELRKIKRVVKPDFTIYIGESITGNDCVEQAKKYNDAISIDGIILTKTDIDEKGGAAISISYVTGKPIIYLATGQEYDKLEKFDKEVIMDKIGL